MKLITFFFLLLSSCAFPKKTSVYVPEGVELGKATVYLYRPKTSIDAANPDVPRFFINESALGKLTVGGYYVSKVEPGEIEISYSGSVFGIPFPWKAQRIKFTVQAAQSYYVKFSKETILLKTELKLVDSYQGQDEMSTVRLLSN